MESGSYLRRLTERLAEGLARLAPAERSRHVSFLRAAQNADGGFSGREGGSDLYYTGFALRGLVALDALDADVSGRAATFLRASLSRQASVVDFYSLLYACLLVQAAGGPDVLADSPPDWPERVAATLESFRTADGGYAKTPGPSPSPLPLSPEGRGAILLPSPPGGEGLGVRGGSTYHTFLVGLCYELLARPLPRPEEVVKFLTSRRREDGGFVEIAPMRRSGTNPTAAAVGMLQLLGQGLTQELRAGVVEFLAEMPSLEGGLRANARAPLADLLSTFTATWTLQQLGARERITAAALAYARSLEGETGGFHGGLWDEGMDVEYTFYGLGVLALLS